MPEKFWEPGAWETYVQQLLSLRYGPGGYQRIPSVRQGDFGLEGFSPTDGNAYQCYCAIEPCTAQERYKHQRAKITADLGKFVRNRQDLSQIFRSLKIKSWILMTPVFEHSELVQHAEERAEIVRQAGLSYVHDDFRVYIQDESPFAPEIAALTSTTARVVRYTPSPNSPWDTDSTQLSAVRRKVAKIPTILASAEEETTNVILNEYAEGCGLLDHLRTSHQSVYEQVLALMRAHERRVRIEGLTTSHNSRDLPSIVDRLEQDIRKEIKALSPEDARRVTMQAVGDWLIRCPLNFPEAAA